MCEREGTGTEQASSAIAGSFPRKLQQLGQVRPALGDKSFTHVPHGGGRGLSPGAILNCTARSLAVSWTRRRASGCCSQTTASPATPNASPLNSVFKMALLGNCASNTIIIACKLHAKKKYISKNLTFFVFPKQHIQNNSANYSD